MHFCYVGFGLLSRVNVRRVYGILGYDVLCGRDIPISVIVKTTAQCVWCHVP